MIRTSLGRLLALAAIPAALTGCGWFGESEKPPLPGTRISVMELNRSLVADPSLADVKVRLPASHMNVDWSQPGGNQTHAFHHLQVGSESLSEAWSVDIGEGSSDDNRILAEPVVAEGVVYVMDADAVVSAYDASSGSNLWRAEVTPEDEDDDLFGGGVAVAEGKVVVTTPYAEIVALDAKSGAILWRVKTPSPVRSGPAVSDGRVFGVTIDNQLVVHALEDGRKLWSNAGVEEAAGFLGGSTPAIDGTLAVAAYTSGDLMAFDVTTGGILWSESLAGGTRGDAVATLTDIRGRPVIDRDLVIAIGNGGIMAAMDAQFGGRVWDIGVGGTQSPWVAGDYIYVVGNQNEILCVTRQDGRIKWMKSLPVFEDPVDKEDPIYWAGPVLVSDRLLVVGSNGFALSFSPYDGALLGTQQIQGGAHVPPVVANGTVYILTDDARLIALR
jgi:outer membrane protein assembly factor BamB